MPKRIDVDVPIGFGPIYRVVVVEVYLREQSEVAGGDCDGGWRVDSLRIGDMKIIVDSILKSFKWARNL